MIRFLSALAVLIGLFTVALWGGSLNLGELVRSTAEHGLSAHPSNLLAAAALFIVLIAEAGRVPVDNPATHLELTMIHEAMVLEYSGADLALVEWASALKELLELRKVHTAQRRATFEHVFRRAIERGELVGDVDIDLLTDLVVGPFFYRRLISRKEVSGIDVDALLDFVLRAVGASDRVDA